MNTTILGFLILYYMVVLGIGFWAMRRGAGKSLEGYLLGGRRLGPLVTALTLQSTSMSGFMFLGAGALGYAEGYWALWYAARRHRWRSGQPVRYRSPECASSRS